MVKLPELYNRESKALEYENTYKVDGLAFLYHKRFGKAITGTVLNKRFTSKVFGKRVKSRRSISQIPKFIEYYNIDTHEIKRDVKSFKSFNDFFIRELKDGARPIDQNPEHLISPADSRLLVFDLAKNESLPVKGYWYKLEDLIRDKKLVKDYADGWCFIYRLAPSDYHRYCYIDKGYQHRVRRLKGVLHSVNPIALSVTKSLLAKNYRECTMLHTENFGEVLQLEVGAMLVGKVIQHHMAEHSFERGEEKGYFEYGGSTIVQLFKKGTITPDADILEYSSKKIETLLKMGEKVGCVKK